MIYVNIRESSIIIYHILSYLSYFNFYFLFTNTDWQNSGRFLNLKIQEGEAHNIFCPAYDCFQLVPVDIIESVVSKEMDRRYLQFDIKVNYQTVLVFLNSIPFYKEKLQASVLNAGIYL